MKRLTLAPILLLLLTVIISSFDDSGSSAYHDLYDRLTQDLQQSTEDLTRSLDQSPSTLSDTDANAFIANLSEARLNLKAADFWLRYLAPVSYRQLHSPLPVEYEVEVFEKWEAPYTREGGGLMLAEVYLDEGGRENSELQRLLALGHEAALVYSADSITERIVEHHHFFLTNRLYLLNLASIYTTAFECPDTDRILPELKHLAHSVNRIYEAYQKTWPDWPISESYRTSYLDMLEYLDHTEDDYDQFDHYQFIQRFVNPLFGLNQAMIRQYRIQSRSFMDYSLNNQVSSIFDKELYEGHRVSGMYASVKDEDVRQEIINMGELLFFDPILSGNNKRSCASCHDPEEAFTANGMPYHMHFNNIDVLTRNTPSLLNSIHNHLLHLDGQHINPVNQGTGVMTNPDEMGGDAEALMDKVMSVKTYKKAFERFAKHTYGQKEITLQHLASALAMYYSQFSYGLSDFDRAMHKIAPLEEEARLGFNLFMGKAQCATCHFPPQFNGVKPPYSGSEFEVIGVPVDKDYSAISPDSGRFKVHPVDEMLHAFRTTTVRNIELTAPYMHNGVFNELEEVIEFYNNGGGLGHGLDVPNQTLPADSLNLTPDEEQALISFMLSLTEDIPVVKIPDELPVSSKKSLSNRQIGGEY